MMKKICCILLLSLAVASAFVEHKQEWQAFKEKFNKKYSPKEDVQRQKIYIENKFIIAGHNKRFDKKKESFRMGINQFSDMLPKELNEFKGFSGISNENKVGQRIFKGKKSVAYPDSVDWRDSGCVSSVKNQGQCGSSWIFSVTGSIESVCCIKYGDPVTLSTQNLVDCVDGGCTGGTISEGYEYCEANGGIDTEASYPDTGSVGTCQFDADNAQCACTGYEGITSGSEDDLLAAVATVGPVASAIDASQLSFQLYAGGIYYDAGCSSDNLDHGILVVGYGTENEDDYWIVKNSWGASWGESGYIKMARNRDNNCGIATAASYPLV